MAGRLEGKVVLISGAAHGQGAAELELFAREGAAVIGGDVLEDVVAGRVGRLRDDGLEAHGIALDVRKRASWEAAVHTAEERYGRLDAVVNNAGVAAFASVHDVTDEEWAWVIDVNQSGVLFGMAAAVPALRRAGAGAIVNISSVFGHGAVPGYIAYQASKGAVLQMTRAAAVEYAAEGIRVNSISPGLVMTEMTKGEPPEAIQDNLDQTPLGRAGQPLDIAYGALYLVSEEAGFVTGTDLVIDGGYLAQ